MAKLVREVKQTSYHTPIWFIRSKWDWNRVTKKQKLLEMWAQGLSRGRNVQDQNRPKGLHTLQDKDSLSDLYHRLINLTQEQSETLLNHLFRSIEHLSALSREPGAEKPYSDEQIWTKFLKAVAKGLINAYVKHQIKKNLDDTSISNDILNSKIV